MKLLKKVFSRMTITILLLIIEVIFLYGILSWFVNYMSAISIISFIISILVVLALVKTNEASAIKIAWIIVIMAIPLMGGILYLLFGSRRPVKKMREKFEKSHAEIICQLQQNSDVTDQIRAGNERLHGTIQSIFNSSSYPVYDKTNTKYYPFGELMYADMLDELKKAKHSIYMEYFIISDKSTMWRGILEILKEKAAEGVDIRLLYDDLGSVGMFSIRQLAELIKAKIKVIPFNPFVPALAVRMNNRDHRKIMVIDGHTAFNGGINIADEYINKDDRLGVWKDTGLMVKGTAVYSFALMFIETWNSCCAHNDRINDIAGIGNTVVMCEDDGFVLPYGDCPLDGESLGENTYVEILSQAKHYVTIFTPYLIISEKMIYALQMAAQRGVDVKIVTPGIPDKAVVYRVTRSYYSDLLKSGVKIYEYTPGFLHAKSFICDDEIAVVGTINLDYRSLYLHFECATLLYKTDSIASLKEDTYKTIQVSRQVSQDDCRRGFFGSLFDAILHVFAPLM